MLNQSSSLVCAPHLVKVMKRVKQVRLPVDGKNTAQESRQLED